MFQLQIVRNRSQWRSQENLFVVIYGLLRCKNYKRLRDTYIQQQSSSHDSPLQPKEPLFLLNLKFTQNKSINQSIKLFHNFSYVFIRRGVNRGRKYVCACVCACPTCSPTIHFTVTDRHLQQTCPYKGKRLSGHIYQGRYSSLNVSTQNKKQELAA